MRAVTIALAAIPVLLGGVGLAVAAGRIDPLDPFVSASEDTPISPDLVSGGESPGSDSGTAVDGRRPHLSVIDGRANLFLPAPLPAILSLLPGSATDLAPLPPTRGSSDAPASTNDDAAGPQTAPATGSDSGPRPQPGARSAPRPVQPTAPVGGAPSVSPPWTPGSPAVPPPEAEPRPPRGIGDPRFDRDLLDSMAGEIMDRGRPPHADTQGRPPHADQTGPPDHANANANAGRNDVGRNNAGNGNGPPAHAATDNRPDHAGGGAQKSDDSRPSTR